MDSTPSFVNGSTTTPAGAVPRISACLAASDRLGAFLVRWGIGRMKYRVEPGLYALGSPDPRSPVLVTANYKLSFDRLREALPGTDAWILVLDTKGVNVWCASGKGTFGTEELLRRIEASGLGSVVAHRDLILPQLSGPGVAAHEVRRRSGFKVVYGPVRARDLESFLDNGREATPSMRLMGFPILERAALVPVELVHAAKIGLVAAAALSLIAFLSGSRAGGPELGWDRALFAAMAVASAVLAGAVLTPLLLPWLPGRAFSLKGMSLGVAAALFLALRGAGGSSPAFRGLGTYPWFLVVPALSSYFAMNFTGASTYTSLSGVRKEMRWALPLQVGAGGLGFFTLIGSLVLTRS